MGFKMNVALQENSKLLGVEYTSGSKRIYCNRPPEDNHGRIFDIGFGHKITPDEWESQEVHGVSILTGITYEQAMDILEIDIKIHRKSARSYIGTPWYGLDERVRDIFTDYSFTGTLYVFPRFRDALLSEDYSVALTEYKRYYTSNGVRKELSRRNQWIEDILIELAVDSLV